MLNENWKHVDREHPCPVCHKTDWCVYTTDGMLCICRRKANEHPTKDGSGWFHRLEGAMGGHAGRVTLPNGTMAQCLNLSQIEKSQIKKSVSAAQIAAHFAGLPRGALQTRILHALERELGLPFDVMLRLDWCWDARACAVAMPMRDAAGAVTGIRYRALGSGAKWAMRGSTDGLFFDPAQPPQKTLVVCEGATDAAAAIACGTWAVGRSSCGTGRDLILALIRRTSPRRVKIVADNDRPKPSPGGGTWQPGIEGANRLAEALRRVVPVKVVLPPDGHKDLREWFAKRGGGVGD